MDRVQLGEVELEYVVRGANDVRGAGEPVILIHPGIFTDWFTPLLREPALNRYRLVHYHRQGCAGSRRLSGPVSLIDQAAHARRLMQHLGIHRAHVVGHSSSGNVAIQLALDSPESVQSLAILEPALMSVPSAATARQFVASALQMYQAGDRARAVDTFLRGVCGPNYRMTLDRVLPGGFDGYVEDANTFFEQEFPALQQWSFRLEDAKRISQPTLAVVGERSLQMSQIWGERQQVLLDWLPNVEAFVLPGAGHLLQIENAVGMAEALGGFFGRHGFPRLPDTHRTLG
jgi:pimeloyl-ACP methyl ester carboxylesterase